VKDAEWLAELVCHGLIRPSFVPPKPLRELRDLLRYRRKLVEDEAAERNRLQKLLETANIKLASVASDVLGVSGQAILRALIAGTASPEEMADLARGRLRRKRRELALALDGRFEEHHRFLLAMRTTASRPPSRTSPRSTRGWRKSSLPTTRRWRCSCRFPASTGSSPPC